MKIYDSNYNKPTSPIIEQKVEVQKNLEENKRIYEHLIKKTKEQGENKISKLREANNQQLLKINDEHNERLNKANESTRKLAQQLDEEKQNISTQYKASLSKENDEYKNKHSMLLARDDKDIKNHQLQNKYILDQERTNFKNNQMINDNTFRSALDNEFFEHQKAIQQTKQTNNKKLLELQKTQEQEYKDQLERYKSSIDNANQSFLQKYNEVTSNHKKTIDLIKNDSEKKLKIIKDSVEKEKELHSSKTLDSFYHPLTLNPTIKDNINEYHISLLIPEYEKDFVQISGKDKTLRLSYSRDYKDTLTKDDDKSINKYSKTESYVKLFNVAEPITAKDISHTFKDNVLTFIVKKA